MSLKNSLGLFLSASKKKQKKTHFCAAPVSVDLQIRMQAAGKDRCGSCPVHTCQISGLEQSSSLLSSSHYYFTAVRPAVIVAEHAPSAADKAPRSALMKTFINFLPPFIQLNLRVLARVLV